MGDFWKIASATVVLGVMGSMLGKKSKEEEEKRKQAEEEEKRRKKAECIFSDGITHEEFKVIVQRSGKGIKRLTKLSVDEMRVFGVVHSQSGISDWKFQIDFSDYGHLTGRYWLTTDNGDSQIPQIIAGRISDAIKYFPECVDEKFEEELDEAENAEFAQTAEKAKYCPYCGEKLVGINARFCGYCGKRVQV